jgi:hypothetical protein
MGRVGGIEIGANWTWLLFLALLAWSLGGAVFPSTNPELASGTYAAMALAAAPLFLVSIVLHAGRRCWRSACCAGPAAAGPRPSRGHRA